MPQTAAAIKGAFIWGGGLHSDQLRRQIAGRAEDAYE
jgi:hypothetical protein